MRLEGSSGGEVVFDVQEFFNFVLNDGPKVLFLIALPITARWGVMKSRELIEFLKNLGPTLDNFTDGMNALSGNLTSFSEEMISVKAEVVTVKGDVLTLKDSVSILMEDYNERSAIDDR